MIRVAPTVYPRGAPPTVYGWGGGTPEVTGPVTIKCFEIGFLLLLKKK